MTASAPIDRTESILRRVAYARHDASKRLRDLDGERSDTSGGTDDEDRLSGLNLPVIADRLKSRRARDRDGGRLLECEVRRLRSQLLDRGGREVRERAVADPVDSVADMERADVWTDRFDTTRDVAASHPNLRLHETARRTERERHPGHEVPIPGEQACSLNPQQHLTAVDRRRIDVLEVQDVRPAVLILNDGLHGDPLPTAGRDGEALATALRVQRRSRPCREYPSNSMAPGVLAYGMERRGDDERHDPSLAGLPGITAYPDSIRSRPVP